MNPTISFKYCQLNVIWLYKPNFQSHIVNEILLL